jgi:hypothetical protein
MPATIQVEKQSEGRYRVTVSEGGSQSSHLVTVPGGYQKKLTTGRVSTEELVRRSFEFLLEREPKESILSSFDLPVIGRYFPEYESEITKRLAG